MSGIYIHIPFCKQACHYCDFHFSTSLKKKEEMVQALLTEIEMRKDEFANQEVATIYFGGGTPSILSVSEIEQLIQQVYTHYTVVDTPEITLEANPDDLQPNVFVQYKNIGINRLSIGVQSFFEEDLQLMNRAHNATEASICIEEATKYFDNITIDLIYGIPNMSNQRWLQNIQTALDFGIPHISSYALTVEPKTALANFIAKGTVPDVDDAVAQEHFYILVATLAAHGFVHYELSNFGKPDYFSKNNTAYWLGKKYIGIGPSAHSYNGTQRSWNVTNNTKYIKAITTGVLPSETETLSVTDRYNEAVMTGLRTIWGVSVARVASEFGAQYKTYLLEQASKPIENGLLTLETNNEETVLKTTAKGKFLADGLASDLFLLNLE
ncbi:radical SAM family heme chaperone HemW [Neptunitalea lumnitzerae]|uniref:Heme chaperone HemW n=1 Tax=Neptunitalea lumnitzerae TaxID=2965509 RepID=A0ABQ5MFW2_9FLAO|nr:radical SAM family heme chaperone HemW [Neptunitalea sp. Y10]GLB47915.1 coproporphyrinogen III oxidase [Neptunitalea sp. Y10]